jgi:hypothetical protein
VSENQATQAVIYGWIEPDDSNLAADYWLTRRSTDSALGYDLVLPDIRVCRRWNGAGAWVSGYYEGRQRQEAELVCLHGNNGWRIEGPATNTLIPISQHAVPALGE